MSEEVDTLRNAVVKHWTRASALTEELDQLKKEHTRKLAELADEKQLVGDLGNRLAQVHHDVKVHKLRLAALEAENAELVAALKVAAEALDFAMPSQGSPLHVILVSAHAQVEAVLAAAGGEEVHL